MDFDSEASKGEDREAMSGEMAQSPQSRDQEDSLD